MLSDEYRYKILRLLEADPEMSQRELARALDISLGKVNYCLRALIEQGFVKARNFKKSSHKKAYLYLLTRKGFSAKTSATVDFLHRRMAEYEALRREIKMLKREASR